MTRNVPVSAPKRVVFTNYIVDVNVTYGSHEPQWNLTIARRTGRGTPGQEVLTVFARYQFKGDATPPKYKRVKAWLLANALSVGDYEFVQVAIRQLNQGMLKSMGLSQNR